MSDITNPRLLYFKGFLFLVKGTLAAAFLVLEARSWRVALLFALSTWCFCRFYYFAFYVIQHYVDPNFRFAGLTDFIRYAMRHGVGSKRSDRDIEAIQSRPVGEKLPRRDTDQE